MVDLQQKGLLQICSTADYADSHVLIDLHCYGKSRASYSSHYYNTCSSSDMAISVAYVHTGVSTLR